MFWAHPLGYVIRFCFFALVPSEHSHVNFFDQLNVNANLKNLYVVYPVPFSSEE